MDRKEYETDPTVNYHRRVAEERRSVARWTFGIVAVVGIISFAAWITHVVRCINTEEYLFLVAGAIAAPIAIFHGIGIWFGVW